MLLEITDTNRDLGEKEKEKVFNKGKTGKYLVEIENMKVLERFFSNSEMQPYIISKKIKVLDEVANIDVPDLNLRTNILKQLLTAKW
jgi:hypothetical protein